jgi:hypothetical protein
VPVICYLFPPITGVSSDPPYLRFCVIRIWIFLPDHVALEFALSLPSQSCPENPRIKSPLMPLSMLYQEYLNEIIERFINHDVSAIL